MIKNPNSQFEVVLLGIIFDPKKRKILLGRRENDPDVPNLTWCFPGGMLDHGESLDPILKKKIKEKTGYDVKNLGAIFANTAHEKPNLMLIYFLCEAIKGKAKAGGNLVEVKWIDPKDIEKYRENRPMNTRLKEYILSLGSGSCD